MMSKYPHQKRTFRRSQYRAHGMYGGSALNTSALAFDDVKETVTHPTPEEAPAAPEKDTAESPKPAPEKPAPKKAASKAKPAPKAAEKPAEKAADSPQEAPKAPAKGKAPAKASKSSQKDSERPSVDDIIAQVTKKDAKS